MKRILTESPVETIEIPAPIYCSRELADVIDPERLCREAGSLIVDAGALLRAADDLKIAEEALEACYRLLAGVPLITAEVRLPEDFHDDRHMFYDEDDPLHLAELEKRLKV